MHLQTLRPRESSFDKFIPPVKPLRLDTTTEALVHKLPEAQQTQPSLQIEDKSPWHECGSYSDVQDAVALGVTPSTILFTSSNATPASLRLVARLGVTSLAVDSAEDLLKIKMYHPQARIILRTNAGDITPPSAAFEYAIDMISDLLEEAASLHLQVSGVNFYVNSQDLATYSQAIEDSPELVKLVLSIEQKLEMLGISADLISNTASSNASSPESPLAFPDLNDVQIARNAFALVS